MKVIINRGARHWDLKPGKDEKGNPVARHLAPGGSIEALDQEESEHLLAYTGELIDAETAVPAVTDKLVALTAERDALKARVAELEGMLPKKEEEKPKRGK